MKLDFKKISSYYAYDKVKRTMAYPSPEPWEPVAIMHPDVYKEYEKAMRDSYRTIKTAKYVPPAKKQRKTIHSDKKALNEFLEGIEKYLEDNGIDLGQSKKTIKKTTSGRTIGPKTSRKKRKAIKAKPLEKLVFKWKF